MFSADKTPKNQKPASLPLYYYKIHQEEAPDYTKLWSQDYRELVVFDLGYVNLCRRIERRYFNGTMELISMEKISVKTDRDEENVTIIYQDVEKFIADYDYSTTHVVIIEWQVPKNYKNIRISTFILSYFHFVLKDASLKPLLLEMRSGFKDAYFPQLKPLNQHSRKRECVVIAKELAAEMNDQASLKILANKKNDDYADTILMAEVFSRYLAEQGWSFPHYAVKRKRITIKINKQ